MCYINCEEIKSFYDMKRDGSYCNIEFNNAYYRIYCWSNELEIRVTEFFKKGIAPKEWRMILIKNGMCIEQKWLSYADVKELLKKINANIVLNAL